MSPESANQGDGQVVISTCIGGYKHKGKQKGSSFFSAISYDYNKLYPSRSTSFKILEGRGRSRDIA